MGVFSKSTALRRKDEQEYLLKKGGKKRPALERLQQDLDESLDVNRKILIERKAVEDGVAKEGPYLRHFNIFGWKLNFYNDIGYRIPIYNMLHTFLSPTVDVPQWHQITMVVNIVAITTALILALVCTFHSAVNFTETLQSDIRFNFGNPSSNFNETGFNHLPYNKDDFGCKVCVPPCVNGYPCFGDRKIDKDGTVASGYYALWWYKQTTEGGESGTPTENYTRYCVLSTMTLVAALVMAVILLGTGSANVFTKFDAPRSYQQDVVLGSYFWWLKIFLITLVLFTIMGILFFFQTLKFLVILKYTDDYIVEHKGEGGSWPFAGSEEPYGFVESITLFLIWLPCLGFLALVSKATHHAYTYPLRPWSNLSRFKLDDRLYRKHVVRQLSYFLHTYCKLPRVVDPELESRGSGPRGNRFDVFLAQAGGVPALEAEVVALMLIDAGIDNVEDLINSVRIDGNWVRDIPGMSLGAATNIVNYARKLHVLIDEGKPLNDDVCFKWHDSRLEA
eukprot:m.339456 g.339456  ORF g.339456 m.339456 type:complete len:506 (-) comp18812_c0_seq1:70-1587(-)